MEKDVTDGLTKAVIDGDWPRARHFAAVRVASMMEKTDSPREVKSLSLSLIRLIDACEESHAGKDYADTPLTHILSAAETTPRGGKE